MACFAWLVVFGTRDCILAVNEFVGWIKKNFGTINI